MQDWILRTGIDALAVYQQLPIVTQGAITIIFVLGVIVHIVAFNERTVHDAPSLFTTAGIFFTFIGIAEGLLGFDVAHPEATIPTLLAGLKTAFMASVFGVGVALSIKIRYALFGVRNRNVEAHPEDATIGDVLLQLSGVQKALVGNDDSSLLSQMKLSRQDSNDKLDQLNRSQEQFLRNAAENNSKALIEALRAVITDFNEKISEQFGENFKHLNAAVGQLLDWQQTYRSQLEEMIVQQSAAARNMAISSEEFTKVAQEAANFAAVSEKLSGLLTGLEQQRSHIAQTTTALTQLLAKASDGLPKLEEKITQLTEQMTFGVKAHQDQISEALNQASSEFSGAIRDGAQMLTETYSNGVKAFDSSISRGADTLNETVADVKRLVLEATQAANQALSEHMNELSRKTSEQVSKLDTALENELQRALSSLATQLTSLSRRFVEDYTPLTDRLRELVAALGRVR